MRGFSEARSSVLQGGVAHAYQVGIPAVQARRNQKREEKGSFSLGLHVTLVAKKA